MSARRTFSLIFFNRRKSLIFKLILIVPITWFIVTMILSFTEKVDIEKEEAVVDVPNAVQDANVIEIKVEEFKHEGRKPRQSAEEQQPPKGPHPNVLPANAFFPANAFLPMVQEVPPAKTTRMHEIHADGRPDLAVLPLPVDDGPGEYGKPVVLTNLTDHQQQIVKDGWEANAFNQYVSDIMSLHRKLPDVRSRGCADEKYEEDLPSTSVVICFHNEAWSVLLRTVHSVFDRSPAHLLEEIILVDDFSDLPHLGKQLEDYFAKFPKVKILRAKKREGLIRARLLGASISKAPILTYLDSHCECAGGWLEPLLQRIKDNWTTVVCPVIDVIDDDTFQYYFRESGEVNVGGFDWNLQFNWHVMPDREKKRRKHHWEPVWSPTMAGGLFSINKKFFERLGTYDSGFDIWGGENLELSFKTWMCGGILEIIPCSHVGHVFRKRSPYKWKAGVNVLRKNAVRLAEVWMDDYKKYYYDRIGHDLGDFGDITSRKELRKKLQCKTFDWYLQNIFPELFVPDQGLAQGEYQVLQIRGLAAGADTCLDSAAKRDDFHKPIGLWPCHLQGGNQYWLISKMGEIRRDESCLDYAGEEVILYPCHGAGGNQQWFYDNNLYEIHHGASMKCLELAGDKKSVFMSHCNGGEFQKWLIQNYNPDLGPKKAS